MGSKTVTLAPFLGYRGFNPLCESMRLYCVRSGRGCAWGQGHNWPLIRHWGSAALSPSALMVSVGIREHKEDSFLLLHLSMITLDNLYTYHVVRHAVVNIIQEKKYESGEFKLIITAYYFCFILAQQ